MRFLFVLAWVCFAISGLLVVAYIRQITAGPLEFGHWGVQVTQGNCYLYRAHTIIGTTPLASLVIPLVLPMVGWIVLVSKRPGRRRGFPVDGTKGAA
jgi:hypothetical protein